MADNEDAPKNSVARESGRHHNQEVMSLKKPLRKVSLLLISNPSTSTIPNGSRRFPADVESIGYSSSLIRHSDVRHSSNCGL